LFRLFAKHNGFALLAKEKLSCQVAFMCPGDTLC